LGIDLYQENLEEKLDDILKGRTQELTKAEIRHEIRSNHNMTEKILNELIDEGLMEIEKLERKYCVKITKKGILHIRKFNEFYAQIYEAQIKDHYRGAHCGDQEVQEGRRQGLCGPPTVDLG